jgi:hypothetical protein
VPSLTSEVLVGEISLNALQAYELNANDFVNLPDDRGHPRLQRIVFHPGSVLEKCTNRIRQILGTQVTSGADDEEGT